VGLEDDGLQACLDPVVGIRKDSHAAVLGIRDTEDTYVADKDTSEAGTPPCAEACHKGEEVPHNLLEEDTQPIPLPEVDRQVGSNLPGHEPPEEISEDLLLVLVVALEGGAAGDGDALGPTHLLLLQAEPHRCLSVRPLVLAFETYRYSSLFRASVSSDQHCNPFLCGICNTL
jgi:hypothetical protein